MTNQTSDIPANSLPTQPWTARCWELLLILMVFFILAGAPTPRENEPHYLCRLKHFWNPSWCAGDLFLESPEAHLVFAYAFGWMTKWLSLPAFAWTLATLAWALLAWAWQRLSWRVVPVPLASVLSAALWVTLTDRVHLAGEWVVGGVEAKCFAYVFVLIALRELIDQRWNRVWLSLGTASAFHVLVGGWSVVVCGAIWVFERLRDRRSGLAGASPVQQFLAMLPGLIGGGILALAGVLPALSLTWHEPPDVVAAANQIYVFQRLRHHLALLTLSDDDVIHRFVRHGLLILSLCLLVRLNRRAATMPSDGLRIVNWYAWGAVALAAVGLTIEIILWNNPQAAAALLRYYWFRLTDVAVPLAVAMNAVALITTGLAARRGWAPWALVVALVIACGSVADAARNRWMVPIPPSDSRMRDYIAWVDACDWIAANTPPDAVFLTPRRNQSFKWRTGRSEVATWKDIPQDARSMIEWFDRMRTIYYNQVDGEYIPALSLGHVGTERVVAAAHKYGASYVIADNRVPLDLPIVYPNAEYYNDEYVIYHVNK